MREYLGQARTQLPEGIGLEICAVLADAGADIVAVARDAGGLAEARRDVEQAGRECLTVEADLATIAGPRDAARHALAHFEAISDFLSVLAETTAEICLELAERNLSGASAEDFSVVGTGDKWFGAEPRPDSPETIRIIMKDGEIYKNTL